MKILANRIALHRAIANVRRMPMTEEQRRAMFARIYGGGGRGGSGSGSFVPTYRITPAGTRPVYPPGVSPGLTPQRAATHASTLRADIDRLLIQSQNMLEIGERENLQILRNILADAESAFTDAENWKAFTSYVSRHILDAHREPTPGREPFVQFMHHIAQVADEMGKPLPYNWYSLAGGAGRAPSASPVFGGPLMVPAPAVHSGGAPSRSSAPVKQPPADTNAPPGRIVLPIDRPNPGNPPDDRARLRPWTTR